MKKIILTALICCASNAHAEWVKPSERYANEYKKHESAVCPIEKSDIRHFVYFARDRAGIQNRPLLKSNSFAGAQIMYPWAELEPVEGEYDFSQIEADLEYLEAHGKKLFIQLQDATFTTTFKGVPEYLLTEKYEGGVVKQITDDGVHEGWVAKRWNKEVNERFAKLIVALGKAFDGRIEGINLQESAIGVTSEISPGFSNEAYVAAIKLNMDALSSGFKQSATIQ